MKRLLIITNLFWMLLVGAYFFNSCTKSSGTTALILDYKNQKFESLPLASAELLASNYKKNYLKLINETYKTSDAKTIWFSLDDLKNFIWQVEYHAINAGAEISPEDLGIRIYYGQYPTEAEIKNNASLQVLPEFGGKHTLFMVPTVLQDTVNMEFDPRALFRKRKEGTKNEVQPLKTKRSNGYFNFIQDDQSTIMNHGGLCPPCKPPKEY